MALSIKLQDLKAGNNRVKITLSDEDGSVNTYVDIEKVETFTKASIRNEGLSENGLWTTRSNFLQTNIYKHLTCEGDRLIGVEQMDELNKIQSEIHPYFKSIDPSCQRSSDQNKEQPSFGAFKRTEPISKNKVIIISSQNNITLESVHVFFNILQSQSISHKSQKEESIYNTHFEFDFSTSTILFEPNSLHL